MLQCHSKETVDRILSLDRVLFGSSKVFLDRWTTIAGRTSVLQRQDRSWIWVHGIPLHLRSVDLFRRIGEICGGFLEYDERNCPLNAIRIKVVTSLDFSSKVSIHFRNSVFSVGVSSEGLGSLRATQAEEVIGI
ncbi:hypothetical protein LINPERPRIM_LOCUS40669 [Linum perenne]